MIALSSGSVSKEAKLAQKDNLDTHSERVSAKPLYFFSIPVKHIFKSVTRIVEQVDH